MDYKYKWIITWGVYLSTGANPSLSIGTWPEWSKLNVKDWFIWYIDKMKIDINDNTNCFAICRMLELENKKNFLFIYTTQRWCLRLSREKK
jgi:hypothetical protein